MRTGGDAEVDKHVHKAYYVYVGIDGCDGSAEGEGVVGIG